MRLPCAAIALLLGCSAEQPEKATPPSDAGREAAADARTDAVVEDALADGAITDTSTLPPPIEDAAELDYGVAPTPDTHVEATIGPSGGRLAGLPGTSLANVALDVPAGALAADTLLALDLDATPAPPAGVHTTSPYVRVGPDGLAFAAPARLSLPCSTPVAGSALAGLARVGAGWSALLSPIYEPATRLLTVSMGRASGAIAATIPTTPATSISAFAPTTAAPGSIVFLEGTGFGAAPVVILDADAGPARTSAILVSGIPATAVGWSDVAISFRVPAGATTGPITVQTTVLEVTSAGSLVVP